MWLLDFVLTTNVKERVATRPKENNVTRTARPAKRNNRTATRNKPIKAVPSKRRGPHLWVWPLIVGVVVVVAAIWAAQQNGGSEELSVPFFGYEVVNSYPHDPNAYTQGLVFADGQLYEGTGQYGTSSLRRVELGSGKVIERINLDRQYFGEGITVWQDRIVQLTWKGRVGLVYDKSSFQELDRFRYKGEGWGVTHDGRHLIMSNGTATLKFLDPQTYKVARELEVRSNGGAVPKLNELEYIKGEIWANVWYKDYIVRISPDTGEVTGRINLTELFPRGQRPSRDAVLNGIAYDADNDRIFVTGKNWPRLFEIRVNSKGTSQ